MAGTHCSRWWRGDQRRELHLRPASIDAARARVASAQQKRKLNKRPMFEVAMQLAAPILKEALELKTDMEIARGPVDLQ